MAELMNTARQYNRSRIIKLSVRIRKIYESNKREKEYKMILTGRNFIMRPPPMKRAKPLINMMIAPQTPAVFKLRPGSAWIAKAENHVPNVTTPPKNTA